MILDAVEVAILACLISLGLNVWLVGVIWSRDNEIAMLHAEYASMYEENHDLRHRLNLRHDQIEELRRLVNTRNTVIDKMDNVINDLRPKRDAHGRFTR